MADELGISINTTKKHIGKLLRRSTPEMRESIWRGRYLSAEADRKQKAPPARASGA